MAWHRRRGRGFGSLSAARAGAGVNSGGHKALRLPRIRELRV